MMRNPLDEFKGDIDWNVMKSQQKPKEQIDESENRNVDVPLGGVDSKKVNAPYSPPMPIGINIASGLLSLPFHGKQAEMVANLPQVMRGTQPTISESLGQEIGKFLPGFEAGGRTSIKAAEKIGKGIGKGIEYLQPGKEAERFRSTLGQGTSSENIGELSQRAQFASGSRKEEALIPKEKLYSQEGRSNVYDVPKSSLPEGNLPKLSHMIAPEEKFGESEAKALSKAISKYRKSGNIEHFNETAEDIFNIPELGEKAAEKVEDALLMPTKRKSAYFSDSDVTMPYSKKGNLMTRHNQYKENPIMDNYQNLRSAITTQMRKLKGRAKTDEIAAEKYDQMELNLKNLDKDSSKFIETLPENMQQLDKDFRQKYTKYAETYKKGEKETGASLTLRRLAEGRADLLDDSAVVKLFSKPTAADKQAILDMGEGAARNAIYAALQKVPMGDADKMAKTILDLKRTKGFDNIIKPEMEEWANNMLTHVSRANIIKGSLATVGGMAAGAPFGGFGMAVGAFAPHAPKIAKYLHKHMFKK